MRDKLHEKISPCDRSFKLRITMVSNTGIELFQSFYTLNLNRNSKFPTFDAWNDVSEDGSVTELMPEYMCLWKNIVRDRIFPQAREISKGEMYLRVKTNIFCLSQLSRTSPLQLTLSKTTFLRMRKIDNIFSSKMFAFLQDCCQLIRVSWTWL